MKKALLIAAAALLALTGCGPAVPTQLVGTVIDREHERAHDKKTTKNERYQCGTETKTSTTGTGTNKRTTTTSVPKYCNRKVPTTTRVAESWEITVRDDATGKTYELDVNASDYARYPVGSKYDSRS